MDRLDRLENPGLRSAARKVYYLDFGPPPVMRPLAKPVGSVASWFFRISVGFDPKKTGTKANPDGGKMWQRPLETEVCRDVFPSGVSLAASGLACLPILEGRMAVDAW